MKKHGLIWWLCIGWWWWLCFGWWITLLRLAAKSKTQAKADELKHNTERHRIVGVDDRVKEVMSLAVLNPNYKMTKKQLIAAGLVDQSVYEYNFSPAKAELVPEPDNPYDPKAIKVIVEGRHIGYIKSGSCAHIHKLLQADQIADITCQIGGGRYKRVSVLGQVEYEKHVEKDYDFESDTAPFSATVAIMKKD